MSYVIKGLTQPEDWGRSVVDVWVRGVETYGVYFVDSDGMVDLIAEFRNLDDAHLFVRTKES